MPSFEIIVEIVEQLDVPGSWGVEARRDGTLLHMAIFGGSDAKRRAIAYARENYTLVLPPRVRAASSIPAAPDFKEV